jgi:hypothetical protein
MGITERLRFEDRTQTSICVSYLWARFKRREGVIREGIHRALLRRDRPSDS